jgi:hypothetical protein
MAEIGRLRIVFVGNINKVKLGTSSFETIISQRALYTDKSRFIEHFLTEPADVQIIARQRRLGKSLNMDMLRCFLTDRVEYSPLFENLSIRQRPLWDKVHSAPVFLFDFKNLDAEKHRMQIKMMIKEAAVDYVNQPSIPNVMLEKYQLWVDKELPDTDGIRILTEIVHAVTGKKSYILIDEYDKLLMDNAMTNRYLEIRHYMTALLSAGLKGNPCLEKALLTGVTRISHEGMFSGLNNTKTYDVFSDTVYAEDYGLTEEEIRELSEAVPFDRTEAKNWYNGIKIGGRAIYNTYGVMSMISDKKYGCYWGNTGTLALIPPLLNDSRRRTLLNLLTPGTTATVEIENSIGPEALYSDCPDETFYSLLVQAGYLSLEEWDGMAGVVAIPNVELREVWRRFLLSHVFHRREELLSLLVHINTPAAFAEDMELFLAKALDDLSYHDLPYIEENGEEMKVPERDYHLLLYAILLMGKDRFKYKSIRSNRESGDGRYDICLELSDRVIVFELKSATGKQDLETLARAALKQAVDRRYGTDLGLPVLPLGLAFRGKTCRVRVAADK